MSERPAARRIGRVTYRVLLPGLVVAIIVAGCGADATGAGAVPAGSTAGRPAPSGATGPSGPSAREAGTGPDLATPSTAAGSPGTISPTAAPSASAAPSVAPSPAATAAASPTLSPAPTLAPRPGPFEMDLYENGDFVSEADKVMCVPAAMQVMINIMAPSPDTTLATQRRLYALARRLSPTLKGDGAEPEGWARALERLGHGHFEVVPVKTMTGAVTMAARAIRVTGRPAGLLVWYGAHSWVMSGFRASADPAWTDRFTVTAVRIEDVWYPKVSTIWGRSRPPDALVPVAKLPRDFLPWRMPGGPYPDKAWKYVVVIPVE
jgi:biotin carboxyl carrier protein